MSVPPSSPESIPPLALPQALPDPLDTGQYYLSLRTEVKEYSPQKNLKLIGETLPSKFPCLLAVGGDESDEFRRQGEEFHQV